MRLIEWDLTGLQRLDFALIGVDASYLVPEESQAGSGGESHISGPNN
jgi:hypothetical protein